MRFVPTKTPDQQACLMLHRTRHLFVRQQTAVINAIRAHLAAASALPAVMIWFSAHLSARQLCPLSCSIARRPAENARRLLDRVVHRLDELGEPQGSVGREATERAEVG